MNKVRGREEGREIDIPDVSRYILKFPAGEVNLKTGEVGLEKDVSESAEKLYPFK